MFRRVASAAAAACLVLSSPAMAQTQIPSDAEIQVLLDEAVSSGRTKGVALGILRPDGSRRLLSAGIAGAKIGAVTPEHVFEIGSITKTFTGVLLAEAVRRGEVALEDPVAKHLPAGTRVPTRGGKEITLLDLATHRSGLPRMPAEWTAPDPENPYASYRPEDVLQFLATHELAHDIGTQRYSNYGAGLLGLALVRAAGAKDYKTLVKTRILQPLKLRDTSFQRPERGMSVGHAKGGEPVPYWDVDGLAGAGGLNSTVGDLLTYLDAHAGPARSDLERSMRAAQLPQRDIGKGVWKIGMLWQMRERNGRWIVSHGGGTGGYGAFVAFDPQSGAAVAALGNTDDFDGDFVLEILDPPLSKKGE